MASLQKINYTTWVLDGKRVPAGTPGATKVQKQSAKWYMVFWEAKKLKKVPLSTDKTVAQTMMGDRLRSRELRKGQMVDPRQHHLDRPLLEHFEDYLAEKKGELSEGYLADLRRIVHLIVKETGIETLGDLKHDAIDAYLTGMKKDRTLKSGKKAIAASAGTRKRHRVAINSFADWCEEKDRIERNPLYRVSVPKGDEVKPRRALTADELQQLIDVARIRPLTRAETNNGGCKNKGGKKVYKATIRDETREQLTDLGDERALIYLTTVYTGLRVSELRSLKVAHLNLDATPPSFELPVKYTKNRKKIAKGAFTSEFAAELRRFINDNNRKKYEPVFVVPDKMCKIFQRDREAAGIELEDHDGRFVSFHSLRHSANTLLGKAGVSPTLRRNFMRHSDIRLTLQRYNDDQQEDRSVIVEAFSKMKFA